MLDPAEVISDAFDLLEGLKVAWRKVDPAKGDAIAAGFARSTGGIDVDWLIELLGPPSEGTRSRGFAQPCDHHEYIEPGCPDCGRIA